MNTEPNARELLKDSDHQERHIELHQALDELLADFIAHTGALPSKATVMDLLNWSHGQTQNPTP